MLVRETIDDMPEADREVLVLRGVEQLPYGMISKKLGVAAGTLKVRYHRAASRLAECLPPDLAEGLAAI